MGLFNGHQAKNIDSLVFNPVKCGVTVADMYTIYGSFPGAGESFCIPVFPWVWILRKPCDFIFDDA